MLTIQDAEEIIKKYPVIKDSIIKTGEMKGFISNVILNDLFLYLVFDKKNYLHLQISEKDGKIEGRSGGWNFPPFRKTNCRNKEELDKQIKKYLTKIEKL